MIVEDESIPPVRYPPANRQARRVQLKAELCQVARSWCASGSESVTTAWWSLDLPRQPFRFHAIYRSRAAS